MGKVISVRINENLEEIIKRYSEKKKRRTTRYNKEFN